MKNEKIKKWLLLGTLAVALAFVVTGCDGDDINNWPTRDNSNIGPPGDHNSNGLTKVDLAGQVSEFVKAGYGKIVLSPSSKAALVYLVQDSAGNFAQLSWSNIRFGKLALDGNVVAAKFQVPVLKSDDTDAEDVEVTGLVNGETYTVYVLDPKVITFGAKEQNRAVFDADSLEVNTAKVVGFNNLNGRDDVLTVAKSTDQKHGIAAVIPYMVYDKGVEVYWKDYGKPTASKTDTTTGAIVVQANFTDDSTVGGCCARTLSGTYVSGIYIRGTSLTIGDGAANGRYLVQRDWDGKFARLKQDRTAYEFVTVTTKGAATHAEVEDAFLIVHVNGDGPPVQIDNLDMSSYTVYSYFVGTTIDFTGDTDGKKTFDAAVIAKNTAVAVYFTNEQVWSSTDNELTVTQHSGAQGITCIIPVVATGSDTYTWRVGWSGDTKAVPVVGGAIVVPDLYASDAVFITAKKN